MLGRLVGLPGCFQIFLERRGVLFAFLGQPLLSVLAGFPFAFQHIPVVTPFEGAYGQRRAPGLQQDFNIDVTRDGSRIAEAVGGGQ